ncbi:alkaline phosphatase PhoX [Cyanobacterium aponinum UTEX 3221]|uniref:PhoX family protein n=1 Tax=Cyanobacterium aponinum TaxID=379064 RepID=UPI002B4BB394|nr:alkaline phosphatase PhoX [Cyanobacterium aponinum]WRL37269.1 alkaline phosphatase PhoX [Cyanobacterium aponinum UTEX 3221]
MKFKRRDFLTFLGVSVASTACSSVFKNYSHAQGNTEQEIFKFANFKPVQYPIPLEINNLNSQEQKQLFNSYQVQDDLILPEGFSYDVIASWGDKVGDSRFGYNNDYVAFVETNPNEGYLVVNFEYVSSTPWLQGYEQVLQKSLPQEVLSALHSARENRQGLNIFALPDDNSAKILFQEFFGELLTDQGLGVISIRRNGDGKWERTYSEQDRRITGISGWRDNRYLQVTGPAKSVFLKKKGLGYTDDKGELIIGTFANCAGGVSPWGTVFSAEENFQTQVPEVVMADGTSFSPESLPINGFSGQGNPFGLAGNKYGWMVEVDPANKNDYGTKHTWLGRFRHEAVAIRAEANQPLAVYSGCDRTGGHLYKFISTGTVVDPQDKGNSKLLQEGMLYVAKMNPDGSGEWIPLKADTAINPTALSNLRGELLTIPNPDREKGGIVTVTKQEELDQFQEKYSTLGDLYIGDTAEEIQGAILIDAHFAGNIIGGTCTARPEDVALHPVDQSLVIAFTSGAAGNDGSPDKRVFSDKQGNIYEYGCLIRLRENENDPSALNFTWDAIAVGGEPASGGLGFANPDNLEFDKQGNLWMVTDMPTGLHNQPVRQGDNPYITGALGNNSIWYIPLSGENAGKAYPFGIAPMETETCGLCFNQEQNTLFLAIQHPGEKNGTRSNMAEETREISILTTDGEEFTQTRTIPKGSNWPSLDKNAFPKPSLVAVY